MPKRQNATTGSRRIIDEYGIEVIPLKASYVANAGRRVLIADGDESCGVEEYACRHFNRLGYSTTLLENRPIHVLFATYMWPVVQDASDRRSRIVGFPDRAAYDARIKCKLIWTRLPADFGKPEYAARRVAAFFAGQRLGHQAPSTNEEGIAHSDDHDHPFRRIATTYSDRSRPLWRGA
jgi:hypothetical protein